ncbi:hypothetical protein [Priestia megaterium]|uniref:Uncharacterized protein n=1 Tax=Priestia megaterium (strain DSM 319 / IMG 1521) TaxID=592022 RepID=D5DGT7_PRIM3|nr:hypothetical protein [Priestia megaterium]ADF39928.1 hypothetical protein BMD_3088 [Priestia megaterium DSM 319]MED4214700.1 hypothetical protein [Priestia megaterium]
MKHFFKTSTFWIGLVVGIALTFGGYFTVTSIYDYYLGREQLKVLTASQKNLRTAFKEYNQLMAEKKTKKQFINELDDISNTINYEYNELASLDPTMKTMYKHTSVIDDMELMIDNIDSIYELTMNDHKDATKPLQTYVSDLMEYVEKDMKKEISMLSK